MTEERREELFDQDLSIFEDIIEMVDEIKEDDFVDKNEGIKNETEENIDVDEGVNDESEDGGVNEDAEDEVNEEIDDGEGETNEEDTSLFMPYAKFLVDNDILSTLDIDKFDGTAEGLLKAQQEEVNYHVNKYKETLPPEVKKLVDGYESGIPFDQMLKISSDRIRYDNIKEDSLDDNIDLQKNVVAEYLKKTTKFNESRINKMIDRLENNAELEDEAKSSLTELKQIQDVEEQEALKRSQEEQAEAERYQAKVMTQLKEKIDSTTEVIPGVKVNKIMRDKIEKNLTTPVAFDNNNMPINKVGLYSRNNPIEFEVILNYLFEATNEFKDWSVFGKSGKSKAINELEAASRHLDKSKLSTKQRRTNQVDNSGIFDAIKNL
jgi:hypothetical protein